MNAHKVSYDKLTSNLTCPLAVTKRSYNYFMSCHYAVITVYLSYQHNKINLYGLIDLLHFDNTKIFAKIMSHICHNPSLGLVTKTRAYEGTGQEGNLGVTFHAPRRAKECEGMNPHTPK